MRTAFPLRCPLSPCCDTALLLGSCGPSGALGGVSGRQCPAALRYRRAGAGPGEEPPPAAPQPGPARAMPCRQHGPGTWAVPDVTRGGTRGSTRCRPLGLCLGRRQRRAAAAGGSWKELLPVSTDPESKVQARRARVSLGRARLPGEGWEFLKAPGVAWKSVNF